MRRTAIFGMLAFGLLASARAGPGTGESTPAFPLPLEEYNNVGMGIGDTLLYRIQVDPFNAVATAIFLIAIAHTFLAPQFLKWAHHYEQQHRNRGYAYASPAAGILHFFGEVEAIFGIWCVPLFLAMFFSKGWGVTSHYFNGTVHYTEPLFVVVVMAIASSRPILALARKGLALFGRQSVIRWWFTLLTLGPLFGSFITEPAAMTICALLLADKFYSLNPSNRLKYTTLGLLFVNISVGGTLTHFAAPPVLMVAAPWNWDSLFLLTHFGLRAMVGIACSTLAIYGIFRGEFLGLEATRQGDRENTAENSSTAVPRWITGVHVLFLCWTVFVSHYPALFIGGFLFFLAFTVATEPHQEDLGIRGPLLVGFFLAGLVIHGGLQAWWIEPVLSRLGEIPLLLTATGLTAFNDNAAITYLATLVPDLSDPLKLAVVSGAVAGGGLTVIANAPNPAGQSILGRFFSEGISPVNLALAAVGPTGVMVFCLALFR